MRRLMIAIACSLLTSSVEAASLDEAMESLARSAGRLVDPIRGKASAVVVVMDPVFILRDEALRGQAQNAFTRSFFNILPQESSNAVVYHDEDYFPQLRDLYEREIERVFDEPDLVRRIFSEYMSEGTYDYIILTRIRTIGNRIDLSSLVIRNDRIIGHPQESIAYGRVYGEAWRFGFAALGYNQEIKRSEVFQDRFGNFAAVPSTPAFESSGVEVEARGPRLGATYRVLGRFADEQEAEALDILYTFEEDFGVLETLPVQWGRWGIFLGYEYHQFHQEYLGRGRSLFESTQKDHSVGLGLARGNLLNGVIVSGWALRGETIDETPGAELFLDTDHMYDFEGYRARLAYNYAHGRKEATFRIEGERIDVEYDDSYYNRPLLAEVDSYAISLRFRYHFGGFRIGAFGGIERQNYAADSLGFFVRSVDDESRILGFELGYLIGEE